MLHNGTMFIISIILLYSKKVADLIDVNFWAGIIKLSSIQISFLALQKKILKLKLKQTYLKEDCRCPWKMVINIDQYAI
jgi:hypothetical protein